jgi:hypothetical protein
MKILVLIAILHLIVGHDIFDHPNWPDTADVCGLSYSDRIIGGSMASMGAFPWIAQIGTEGIRFGL